VKRVYVRPTAVTHKTACIHTVTKPVLRRDEACKRVLIFSVHALAEEDITDIPAL